jgi:hypothetical protein
MVGIEYNLLSYGVLCYGFRIYMSRLRLYKGLIELYGKFRRTITSRAYVTGLGLAVEAI